MSTPFELPAEMTIYSAVEIRDALLGWVTEQGAKTSKALEVSAANVSAAKRTQTIINKPISRPNSVIGSRLFRQAVNASGKVGI